MARRTKERYRNITGNITIKNKAKCCHCSGAVYGMGFIGALIYYISNATSFWMGVLGILKAIVWPAFLVFELLKYLGA